jgi:hypothetical protein
VTGDGNGKDGWEDAGRDETSTTERGAGRGPESLVRPLAVGAVLAAVWFRGLKMTGFLLMGVMAWFVWSSLRDDARPLPVGACFPVSCPDFE